MNDPLSFLFMKLIFYIKDLEKKVNPVSDSRIALEIYVVLRLRRRYLNVESTVSNLAEFAQLHI